MCNLKAKGSVTEFKYFNLGFYRTEILAGIFNIY